MFRYIIYIYDIYVYINIPSSPSVYVWMGVHTYFGCIYIFMGVNTYFKKPRTAKAPITPVISQCNTVEHTATHCNTLQHARRAKQRIIPVCNFSFTHIITVAHCNICCNTLQHTTTKCNSLQRTVVKSSLRACV